MFAGQDPIGQRLWFGGNAYEIVGVVAVNAALQPRERDPAGVAVTFAMSRIVRPPGGEGSSRDPAWPVSLNDAPSSKMLLFA